MGISRSSQRRVAAGAARGSTARRPAEAAGRLQRRAKADAHDVRVTRAPLGFAAASRTRIQTRARCLAEAADGFSTDANGGLDRRVEIAPDAVAPALRARVDAGQDRRCALGERRRPRAPAELGWAGLREGRRRDRGDAPGRGRKGGGRAAVGRLRARPRRSSRCGATGRRLGPWERVRRDVPEFEPIYFSLADAYGLQRDEGTALKVLREAERRWPADAEVVERDRRHPDPPRRPRRGDRVVRARDDGGAGRRARLLQPGPHPPDAPAQVAALRSPDAEMDRRRRGPPPRHRELRRSTCSSAVLTRRRRRRRSRRLSWK